MSRCPGRSAQQRRRPLGGALRLGALGAAPLLLGGAHAALSLGPELPSPCAFAGRPQAGPQVRRRPGSGRRSLGQPWDDPLVNSDPPPVPAGFELSMPSESDVAFNTVVFVLSCIPWFYAAYEFWRRIATGANFGTADPVRFSTDKDDEKGPLETIRIGEDGNPQSSRGARILGKDALLLAYFLTGLGVFTALFSGYAGYVAFEARNAYVAAGR